MKTSLIPQFKKIIKGDVTKLALRLASVGIGLKFLDQTMIGEHLSNGESFWSSFLNGSLQHSLPEVIKEITSSENQKEFKNKSSTFITFTESCFNAIQDVEQNLSTFLDEREYGYLFKDIDFDGFIHNQLFDKLCNEERVEQWITTSEHLSIKSLIERLIEGCINWHYLSPPNNDITITDSFKIEIKSHICESFSVKFKECFHEKLLNNPTARAAYHTLILERLLIASKNSPTTKDLQSLENLIRRRILSTDSNDLKLIRKEVIHRCEEISNNITNLIQEFKQSNLLSRNFKLSYLPSNHKVFSRSDGFTQLRFDFRRSPFVGRQQELTYLDSFIQSKDEYQWMMIQGAAGIGKSRLALELCDKLHISGWVVGFLEGDVKQIKRDEIQHFLPQRNLLIVIDYLNNKTNEIALLLDQFAVCNNSNYKVRIILLERTFSHKWQCRNLRYAETFCFSEKPLEIKRLSKEQLYQIIYLASPDRIDRNLLSEKQIWTHLSRIDPDGKPLFALIVALAWYDKEFNDLESWNNVNDALNWVINRETRVKWSKIQEWDIYKVDFDELIVLFCLIESISVPDALKLFQYPNDQRYVPGDLSARYVLDNLLEISGDGLNNEQYYIGLKPDLLASQFICNWVRTAPRDHVYRIFKLGLSLNPSSSVKMIYLTEDHYVKQYNDGLFNDWNEYLSNEAFENSLNDDLESYVTVLHNMVVNNLERNETNAANRIVKNVVERLNSCFDDYQGNHEIINRLLKLKCVFVTSSLTNFSIHFANKFNPTRDLYIALRYHKDLLAFRNRIFESYDVNQSTRLLVENNVCLSIVRILNYSINESGGDHQLFSFLMDQLLDIVNHVRNEDIHQQLYHHWVEGYSYLLKPILNVSLDQQLVMGAVQEIDNRIDMYEQISDQAFFHAFLIHSDLLVHSLFSKGMSPTYHVNRMLAIQASSSYDFSSIIKLVFPHYLNHLVISDEGLQADKYWMDVAKLIVPYSTGIPASNDENEQMIIANTIENLLGELSKRERFEEIFEMAKYITDHYTKTHECEDLYLIALRFLCVPGVIIPRLHTNLNVILQIFSSLGSIKEKFPYSSFVGTQYILSATTVFDLIFTKTKGNHSLINVITKDVFSYYHEFGEICQLNQCYFLSHLWSYSVKYYVGDNVEYDVECQQNMQILMKHLSSEDFADSMLIDNVLRGLNVLLRAIDDRSWPDDNLSFYKDFQKRFESI